MLHFKHPGTDSPAVEARGLVRSLPLGGEMVQILKGITFTIPRGAWAAITGPSGSGKSTLLGLIAGLDSPNSGRIVVDGVDITTMGEGALARLRNERIGIVFQSFHLIPTLTAQENVELPLYVRKGKRQAREKAEELLDLVGLGDRRHHRPHQLSGGQQQRVAIARALVTDPAILVADEPTGNLDTATGEQVLDLIARLRDELGITIIVATHDPEIAARADLRLHLVDGQLVAGPHVPATRPQITLAGRGTR